ncbi:MAG: DUF302 domain-containing protein [Chromatiales bacterium]|nr:DUF302 domain-containing protein [Chromatiales bacterium]
MKRLFLILVLFACSLAFAEEGPQAQRINIEQTVVKMTLDEGVSPEDAIDSMKLRANNLNMMFVAHQPLGKQVQAMGFESKRLEIFQFCDPLTARKMVDYASIFAAYMPCRIALVEESDGSVSLMMLNLDMLIQGASLEGELHDLAVDVNTKLMSIMEAGATGDL